MVDVSRTTDLSFEFSTSMSQASVQVTPSPAMDLSPASWERADRVVYTLRTPLAPATRYTVMIAGTDLQGVALPEAVIFFRTAETQGPGPAVTPTVLSTSPETDAVNVSPIAAVTVTFSESMDRLTTEAAISSTPEVGCSYSWSEAARTVTCQPQKPLTAETRYEFVVSKTARSQAGLLLTSDHSFRFTTAVTSDRTPPAVVSSSPPAGAVGVDPGSVLRVRFSQMMDRPSTEAAFAVSPSVACELTCSGNEISCAPSAPLTTGTLYTMTVGTGAKNLLGTSLPSPFSTSFQVAVGDIVAPEVASVSPGANQTGVATNTNVRVVFSEPMNRESAQAAFAITSPSGFGGGAFSWNGSGTEMTYTPPSAFAIGARVEWRVGTGAKDLAGNALAEVATRAFTVIRETVVTLGSVRALDGFVSSVGNVETGSAGVAVMGTGDIYSGGLQHRWTSFVTFDLRGLPEGTTEIREAILEVTQAESFGSPFAKHGNLLLQSVNYGGSLESSDANLGTLGGRSSVLSSDTASVRRRVTVTSSVADDFAQRGARGYRSQYRIRFERTPENDGVADTTMIRTINAAAADRPLLRVRVRYP